MRANLSKKILTLMCDGKERTIAQVVVTVECTRAQADVAMHNGRRLGYYSIASRHYAITDFGRTVAAQRFKTPEELAESARLRMVRFQERRRAANKEKAKAKPAPELIVIEPQPPKVDLVSLAMRTRPALDMAWMSVAREQEALNVCRSGAREGVGA